LIFFTKYQTQQSLKESKVKIKKVKDTLDLGFQIFEKSWKKGISFFIENNVVSDTNEVIANFLFNTPSLNPVPIDELFEEHDERSQAILRCFMSLFDFKEVPFEAGFRTFFTEF
jgi:Sec7-like guanine-nucleotide exchange factor